MWGMFLIIPAFFSIKLHASLLTSTSAEASNALYAASKAAAEGNPGVSILTAVGASGVDYAKSLVGKYQELSPNAKWVGIGALGAGLVGYAGYKAVPGYRSVQAYRQELYRERLPKITSAITGLKSSTEKVLDQADIETEKYLNTLYAAETAFKKALGSNFSGTWGSFTGAAGKDIYKRTMDQFEITIAEQQTMNVNLLYTLTEDAIFNLALVEAQKYKASGSKVAISTINKSIFFMVACFVYNITTLRLQNSAHSFDDYVLANLTTIAFNAFLKYYYEVYGYGVTAGSIDDLIAVIEKYQTPLLATQNCTLSAVSRFTNKYNPIDYYASLPVSDQARIDTYFVAGNIVKVTFNFGFASISDDSKIKAFLYWQIAQLYNFLYPTKKQYTILPAAGVAKGSPVGPVTIGSATSTYQPSVAAPSEVMGSNLDFAEVFNAVTISATALATQNNRWIIEAKHAAGTVTAKRIDVGTLTSSQVKKFIPSFLKGSPNNPGALKSGFYALALNQLSDSIRADSQHGQIKAKLSNEVQNETVLKKIQGLSDVVLSNINEINNLIEQLSANLQRLDTGSVDLVKQIEALTNNLSDEQKLAARWSTVDNYLAN